MSRCPDDCPFCYANVRGRSSYKGHRQYRRPRAPHLESVSEMLRRQAKPATTDSVASVANLGEFGILYPALAEFLFLSVWEEDRAPRQTGTALLFGDGTHLKAMLNDRDQSLVAFLTIDPSEDILVALDTAILAVSTDWRPAKKFAKR